MAEPGGIRTGPARWAWLVAGWLAVAVGTAGVVVPGLPTTGPFVLARLLLRQVELPLERWGLQSGRAETLGVMPNSMLLA